MDFGDVRANDWLAVNQFRVIEGQHNRRPDIVVFINGLPLGLIELKTAADKDATVWSAYAQLQTYKAEIASLPHYNAALVVSDGLQAHMGSVTANQEWFKVWRTIDGEGDAPKTALELEVLVRGVFERRRFLDLLQHFIVFEEDPDSGALHKIIAGFRIAGAQTVLASHWKVSAKATSQLMTEFMRRWRSGEPCARAWREEQARFRPGKGANWVTSLRLPSPLREPPWAVAASHWVLVQVNRCIGRHESIPSTLGPSFRSLRSCPAPQHVPACVQPVYSLYRTYAALPCLPCRPSVTNGQIAVTSELAVALRLLIKHRVAA
jgi:hypothetical protein